ncbi:MAG: NERD domain-containing protein [Bacteroidetes bacterium]|nr:NERD domain-containing protein [Bacteroidota bacterium]
MEQLSDDYHLINDFTCTFNPPIYKRQAGEYIWSIQIDHILISPSGIFMIETKNRSEHSLSNLSLRSPVEQSQRSSFALYKILNTEGINSLNKHHWGERKIPIRNLIVLINQKPNEEFQYVKILTLKELRNYVAFFKPIFSNDETALIAKYLINRNEQS